MDALPSVSIVVPAYNLEGYIGDTIQSVIEQSKTDWELVIIDDGSLDNTVKVVESYQDSRIRLICQENSGVSAARNRAENEIRGSMVLFLDGDDVLMPGALERLVDGLEAHPEACAAYGPFVRIDENGCRIDPGASMSSSVWRPTGNILHALLQRQFLQIGSVLIRARCLARAGWFNLALRLEEDWEFWCRIAAVGDYVFLPDEPIMAYRIRSGSAARTLYRDIENRRPAINAVFSNPRIASHFSDEKFRSLEKRKYVSSYELMGRHGLRSRDWPAARVWLWRSVCGSPARIRTWALLFCALIRWIPGPIAKRIGL